jgi:hypothetical protein
MFCYRDALNEVRKHLMAGMPIEFAVKLIAEEFMVNESDLYQAIDESFE